MKSFIGIYNKRFEWGFFKPIRLNITEMDATSTASSERLDLKVWNEIVGKMHEDGRGISFIIK